MALLMVDDARVRLLFELVSQCKRFGEPQKDGSYILNIHEPELARRSGLSRETISRHIQKIDHGNIIEARHKNIVIKDLPKLEQLLRDSVF